MKKYTSSTIITQTAASVATPPAGFVTLFVDSSNNHISQKDSSGTVTDLASAGTPTMPSIVTQKLNPSENIVIADGFSGYIPGYYQIVSTFSLEIGVEAYFEIG